MIRRPPRSTPLYSSAASDVYKRQVYIIENRARGSLRCDPAQILNGQGGFEAPLDRVERRLAELEQFSELFWPGQLSMDRRPWTGSGLLCCAEKLLRDLQCLRTLLKVVERLIGRDLIRLVLDGALRHSPPKFN